MSLHAWMAYNARTVAPQSADDALPPVPPMTDPLADTIRTALDARALGLSAERAEELMERRHPGVTTGIVVEEQPWPSGWAP